MSGLRVKRMRDLYRQNGVTRLECILGVSWEKEEVSLKEVFRKIRKFGDSKTSKLEVGGTEKWYPLEASRSWINLFVRRTRMKN